MTTSILSIFTGPGPTLSQNQTVSLPLATSPSTSDKSNPSFTTATVTKSPPDTSNPSFTTATITISTPGLPLSTSTATWAPGWCPSGSILSPCPPTTYSIVTTTEKSTESADGAILVYATTSAITDRGAYCLLAPSTGGCPSFFASEDALNYAVEGLSGGAIAAIVIGVLMGIFLLFLVCMCLCFRGVTTTVLGLFGIGPRAPRRPKNIQVHEERHHTSSEDGRTWVGLARPPRRQRQSGPPDLDDVTELSDANNRGDLHHARVSRRPADRNRGPGSRPTEPPETYVREHLQARNVHEWLGAIRHPQQWWENATVSSDPSGDTTTGPAPPYVLSESGHW